MKDCRKRSARWDSATVEELVVRRVVSRSGKNRVYINGALASLASLAAIGESLINICGQHEHQMILNPENHTDILDEFGGLLPLRSDYREAYDRYRSLKEKLRGLQELPRKREEREDLLRFQIGEIAQADVRAGEDAALLEEKKILANVQKLIDFAEGAYETLYGKGGSVLTEFRSAASAVKEIRKIDPALKLSDGEMDELYYRIEEAAFALRDYAKRLSFDPGPSGGPRRAAGASGAPETEIRRDARCGPQETGRSGERSSGISPPSKRRSGRWRRPLPPNGGG